MPWLGALLASLLGTSVSRMLVGAGLALASLAAVTPLVLSAMNAAAQGFGDITGAVLQIMLLSGIGEGISIIGSAILTRMIVDTGRIFVTRAAVP